jgi:hypothetical protein
MRILPLVVIGGAIAGGAFRAAAHGDAKKIEAVRGGVTRAPEEIERLAPVQEPR